jgi:hypothetical protein
MCGEDYNFPLFVLDSEKGVNCFHKKQNNGLTLQPP